MASLKFKELSGTIGWTACPYYFHLFYFCDIVLTSLYDITCSGISTLHAVFIATISLYFVFWSELFSDHNSAGLITERNSPLSTFTLGVSVCILIYLILLLYFIFRK